MWTTVQELYCLMATLLQELRAELAEEAILGTV